MHKISFKGAGNVAFHLAKAFTDKNIPIHGFYSKRKESSDSLAVAFHSKSFTKIEETLDSDWIIIAVPDDQIESVALSLKDFKGLVSHTAGSVSLDTLKRYFPRPSVFYPLQTLTKGIEVDFSEVPLCLEYINEADGKFLHSYASKISNRVLTLDSESRGKLHLAAVVANNFSNYLYTESFEYLQKNNLDPSLLIPLLEQTVRKLKTLSPEQAQTGPAKRNDKQTIARHISMLQDDKELLDLYNFVTDKILKKYHEGKLPH